MIGLSWEEVNALVLKARETERERIIKILEEELECNIDGSNKKMLCEKCELIALILEEK